MKRTRVAVAGAGLIGLAHIAIAQKSPTCTLTAIVDPAPAAEAAAKKAGVPLYKSLDELIAKDRPDGVILATPNQLHDVVARQRKHVPHARVGERAYQGVGAAHGQSPKAAAKSSYDRRRAAGSNVQVLTTSSSSPRRWASGLRPAAT